MDLMIFDFPETCEEWSRKVFEIRQNLKADGRAEYTICRKDANKDANPVWIPYVAGSFEGFSLYQKLGYCRSLEFENKEKLNKEIRESYDREREKAFKLFQKRTVKTSEVFYEL